MKEQESPIRIATRVATRALSKTPGVTRVAKPPGVPMIVNLRGLR
jgi:hypothetical protein